MAHILFNCFEFYNFQGHLQGGWFKVTYRVKVTCCGATFPVDSAHCASECYCYLVKVTHHLNQKIAIKVDLP